MTVPMHPKREFVKLFTFNRAILYDWCVECVARRIVLGVAGILLIVGVVPFFTSNAQDIGPTGAELQREVIELRGQTAQLPVQIQALAVQMAVLADHDKQREQREASISGELMTLMGMGGMLLVERILAAMGWKLRDNARDHDPHKRTNT